MADRLTDRIALVFGAGSSGPGWGNGKAAAVLYAREGAKVVAVDQNQEAAAETAAIIAQEGNTAIACAGDVTRSDDIAAIVAKTLAAFGRIDILHNNVGVTVMGDPVTLAEADWQRGLDVNLTSVFLTCKHVLPVMLRQQKGAIINISSSAAVQINDYPYVTYYASKAGLNQMTRSLAITYGRHGIRANVIMPGLMNTPLIHRQISGQYADAAAMIAARDAKSPMGHMGDAWDVAHAALFLASDEAKYITGVCLPVDGGLTCL